MTCYWLRDEVTNWQNIIGKHECYFSAWGAHFLNCFRLHGGSQRVGGGRTTAATATASSSSDDARVPYAKQVDAFLGRDVRGSNILCPFQCFDELEPTCPAAPRFKWLAAAPLRSVWCHRRGSSCRHQPFRIVCVVNVAKQNELSISSRPYVPYNCCTIGSVNCIPIGHMLGQQQRYRNTDSQWSHMTHKVCSRTGALNSSPLDVRLQLNIYT